MHIREHREISVPQLDRYIIIDTHGGAEDVIAIAVTLKLAQRFHKTVLGITCVNGRRSVEQAVHDALIAQQIAGTNVPVYEGSRQSLMLNSEYPACYNIADQSSQLDKLPVSSELQAVVQKEPASFFIAEQIKAYSQELCIITLGPLTNLALAFHRTQTFKVLSSVRINGGAFTGVGNVISSPGSEGNFQYDPEAVHITITNYNNIYLNPIEKTLETSWEHFFKELVRTNKSLNNPLLDSILDILLNNKVALCGPLLTVMPALHRQTVPKVLNVYSEVFTYGKHTAGLLAANWLRLEVAEDQQFPNTKIYSVFNHAEIQKHIKMALFS